MKTIELRMRKICSLAFVTTVFMMLVIGLCTKPANAWLNGGSSADPNYPCYGTHDWIAHHALDWMPANRTTYIKENLNTYLWGTELPDAYQENGGYHDLTKHHVYYNLTGALVLGEDDAAVRAEEEYQKALTCLIAGDYANASKYAGIVTHYISDVAAFGHVMGNYTDWGAEEYHSDYESDINAKTSTYTSELNQYLQFDGVNDIITAYNATLELAYDTTFDVDGNYTCVWMDDTYHNDWWNDTAYKGRVMESLNLAVNLIADVLYRLSVEANYSAEPSLTPAEYIVFSEIYYDTTGTESMEEYIELYNPMNSTVNIANWKICDNAGTYIISGTYTIEPKTYFCIARDSQTFEKAYSKLPDKGDLSLALNNEGDQLTLYDQSGVETDFVAWESGYNNVYPTWVIYADEGKTVQRNVSKPDTNLPNDWISNVLPKPMVQADGQAPITVTQTETTIDTTTTTVVGGAAAVGGGAAGYAYGKKKKK